ncbi:MAG: formate C-acetyltransferase/glycerol dehydratase family glycyl radical enzyme [Desulfobacterium sp.]
MNSNSLDDLKKSYLSSQPELFPERAILITESYRKYAGLPVILQRGHAFKNILENMSLHIEKGELFLGNPSSKGRCPIVSPEFGAGWIDRELDLFADRPADTVAVTDENKAILREVLEFWKDKSLDQVLDEFIPNEAHTSIGAGMITLGGTGSALGNITPDYPKVLEKGLSGIIAEIDEKLDSFKIQTIDDFQKISFWKSAKISCQAVISFAERYAARALELAASETNSAWKEELVRMADILTRVPRDPARTFHEAIQSLWLVYVAVHIESDPHAILLGRFDQYMYPFYENDLAEERITTDQVKDLLVCLWIKCTSMIKLRDDASSKAFAGFPLFQNITVGGQTKAGKDATNALSYLMLEAAAQARTSQPSIGLRVHDQTPKELLVKAAEVIRTGIGYPALMNDKVIIPKQLIRGATMEEARDYCTNCVETDIPGKTDSRAHSGYVNFPKCLLLALNNGKDPDTDIQIGPQTGAFADMEGFEALYQAYGYQVRYFIETIVEAYDLVDAAHAALVPEPFLSAILDDCIASGKTRQQGGCTYNFSGIFGVGLSVVADSLAAIKKLVFDENRVERSKLLSALQTDFEGNEVLRKQLLNKAPKYGNNDDYVDDIACACTRLFTEEVIRHPCIRGGFYIPEMHTVATHVLMGGMTGATPDGRRKGDTFADGISPVGGRDRNGPTQAIQSITKLDHVAVLQGLLYNQKCHPTALDSADALEKLADYIKTFCDLGGHHIQFNIVSRETLEQARSNPEKFKDLVVRVAGYSAYFTELNLETQEEIINRTEFREL